MIPVSDDQITLMDRSGSFSRSYFNNHYMKALIEKYGTPLYLNAVVKDNIVHIKGLVRGTF